MMPTGFLLVGRTDRSVEETCALRAATRTRSAAKLTPQSELPVTCRERLQGAEADPTGLVLGDLDIGELVGRHQDATALLVLEGEDAEVGLQRVRDSLLDLLGRLAALQHELA